MFAVIATLFVASVLIVITVVIPWAQHTWSQHTWAQPTQHGATEACDGGDKYAHDILNASMHAVSHLKSLSGDAFFTRSIYGKSYYEHSTTEFRLKLINEGNNSKIRIDFTGYDYNISDNTTNKEAHECMRVILRNAWILDDGTEYHVFMPELSENVRTFAVCNESIFPYDIILADNIHLAMLFKHAEINGINESENAYIISYGLSYPVIPFATHAELRTWISKDDLIPVKTEVHAVCSSSVVKLCFGFRSYERNVSAL